MCDVVPQAVFEHPPCGMRALSFMAIFLLSSFCIFFMVIYFCISTRFSIYIFLHFYRVFMYLFRDIF